VPSKLRTSTADLKYEVIDTYVGTPGLMRQIGTDKLCKLCVLRLLKHRYFLLSCPSVGVSKTDLPGFQRHEIAHPWYKPLVKKKRKASIFFPENEIGDDMIWPHILNFQLFVHEFTDNNFVDL
jgi:hypothetical protein